VTDSLGRVLVVDDSPTIRSLIALNLEMEGFEVHTAGDGEQAMALVHEVDPQVVTLDVVMPHLDGFDTAARLRADPRTAGLKIAMITAAAQERDLARGRRIGVDAYLTKPFDPENLVRTVRQLVRPGGS
jgi:DNA-binding response OmpR family regulator